MIEVFVRSSYVDDLKAGLPISYLDFWFAEQERIDEQARLEFSEPRPPNVDPAYDVAVLPGHWAAGSCDYFVTARQFSDIEVELLRIEFDLDPLRADDFQAP